MKVNNQELTHVLAALRWCQKYDVDLGAMDHFSDGQSPLEDYEVDKLCEAINCGGFDIVDGDPEAEASMGTEKVHVVGDGSTRYQVCLTQDVTQSHVMLIEAPSQNEAEEYALEHKDDVDYEIDDNYRETEVNWTEVDSA